MRVIIVFIIISTFLFSNCKNSNHKAMTTQFNNEAKWNGSNGYVSVNGLRMYYEIYGKGTPLQQI